MRTVAKHNGNNWILNGTKAWVTNGIEGGAIIVIARSDLSKGHKGVSAFVVPTNTPGIFNFNPYTYYFYYKHFYVQIEIIFF